MRADFLVNCRPGLVQEKNELIISYDTLTAQCKRLQKAGPVRIRNRSNICSILTSV